MSIEELNEAHARGALNFRPHADAAGGPPPTNRELWELIHSMWGDAKAQRSYHKESWLKLQSMLLRLVPPPDAEPERCRWQTDSDDGLHVDMPYQTACGHAFEFTWGGPKANKFGYCCYCGKEIEVKE